MEEKLRAIGAIEGEAQIIPITLVRSGKPARTYQHPSRRLYSLGSHRKPQGCG
jgi:hypothetical protein